jgi:O-antigen/teichoic acid export membrane protein
VVGDAITTLALLATSMVLARTILPADMATFRQVIYLGPLVVGVAELGISSTVYRYYRVYQGAQLQSFLWQVLVALFVLGALGSVVLLALAWPLARSFGNPALAPALTITCGQVLAGMAFHIVRPVLINRGHSFKATFWEAGLSVGASFALIIPLWQGATLNQGLACWMAANALRVVVVWWYVGRPLVAARPAWDRALTRELWSFLWPLQLSRLPGLAMAYFDKVVTSVLLSKADFAAYSLGARHLPFVETIASSVSSVMLPRLVEAFQQKDLDRLCSLWRRACLATAVLTYPVAAFCIWHAKPIMRVMFTSTYESGAIPFAAYAGITLIRVVDYGSLARALNQTVLTLRLAVYTFSISLPLAVALTWALGVWGASLSLLLSTAIMGRFYLSAYARILQRPLWSFFPLKPLVALLVLAFGAVVLAGLVLDAPLSVADQVTIRDLLPRLGILFLASVCLYAGGVWPISRLWATRASGRK